MKIVIYAIGSRGDVQPYIAIGQGLRAAGHTVTLATVAYFRDLVAESGLAYHPVAGDVEAMLVAPSTIRAMESGRRTLRALTNIWAMTRPYLTQMGDDCLAAAQGADVLVASTLAIHSYPIGDALGIAVLPAIPYPLFTPTRAFPNPVWPVRRVPAVLNPLTTRIAALSAWQLARPLINRWARARFGMRGYGPVGPFRRFFQQRTPVMYGYSPSLIPRPAGWNSTVHVTGYWSLGAQAGWQPPADLVEFLAAGPPPVYIGFGSMRSRDPAAATALMVEGLRRAGQRGVLLTGWDGLRRPDSHPEDLFFVESIPHAWLFPRMAAVVHHGGAGTTASGLRAGVPSVLIPHFGDQPFWARQVHQAGVGPEPVMRRDLTPDRLAHVIRQALTDEAMQRRAADLGARIRAEDGVGAAVRVIEAALSG
ncbi:MAG: glycosyltransferase [Anaerolineae bacterium]